MKTVTNSTKFESKMKLFLTKCDYYNANTAMTHKKSLTRSSTTIDLDLTPAKCINFNITWARVNQN